MKKKKKTSSSSNLHDILRQMRMAIQGDAEFPADAARFLGHRDSLAEGEAKAKVETARKMKAMGLDTGTIVEVTRLSLKEVEQI